MRGRLEANIVSVMAHEEINTFLIALADGDTLTSHRLELQKSIEIDDQDIDLGMDTYCIVIDNGVSHYGGIQSCVLENGQLSLDFSKEAEDELGLSGFDIFLATSTVNLEVLRSGLRRLFNGGRDQPKTFVS